MWRLKKKPRRLKLEQWTEWRLTQEPRKFYRPLLQISITLMTEENPYTGNALHEPDPDPHEWK